MINIPLTDGWRLKTDSNNWIIFKENRGREFDEGFYSNLDSAVNGFVEMKIKGFNATSLLALNNSIKSLEIAFCKAIHNLDLEDEGKK